MVQMVEILEILEIPPVKSSRGLKDTVFAIAKISGNFAGNFQKLPAILPAN